MYYTYILKLHNDKYYTGYTSNLAGRIAEHKNGRVGSTKYNLPIELEFYAAFNNKQQAIKFEKYLKSSSGYAFRNKRLIQ